MTRLGLFECLVLLAFFWAGLTAFFLGGLVAVGQVAQALMVVVLWWVGRQVILECIATLQARFKRARDWHTVRQATCRKGYK